MLGELVQILAGAETAPGTGDHDGADGGISGLLERSPQGIVQRSVERVVDLRPVQRDREHGPVACRQHLAHALNPTPPSRERRV